MVEDTVSDGLRIAQLLSSEIHGHERGALGRVRVVDADPDVEPTGSGAVAYAIAYAGAADDSADDENDADDAAASDGADDDTADDDADDRLATVAVYHDRVHVDFGAAPDRAAEAAEREGLRVRRRAVGSPRTHVFVESGAAVKPALRVVRDVAEARDHVGEPG